MMAFWGITLPETNIFAPENRPLESQRFLLETTIFRCHGSLREGIILGVYLELQCYKLYIGLSPFPVIVANEGL